MLGGTEKRTVLLTTVAACGALGIVTASLSGYGTTPLAPFIAAATPSSWNQYAVWEQAAPMVAVLIAVLTTRAWPWLLLVGTVMSLPVTLETVLPNTILSHTALMTASRGGPPVVFIAVLAAAQQLFRQGAKVQGIVVVALGIGAQIFAAGLTGSAVQPTEFWRVGLTVVGVAGAVLAVATVGRRTDWAAVNRPAARIVTASVGVVLLPLVAVVINDELVNTAFGLSGRGLASHPELVPAAVGVVLVVGGATLCAVAGARVAFVVAVAALTQLGITGPLVLALYSVSVDPVLGWIAAAVGVAAGCVAAVSRWRTQLAVGGGLVSAIVLFVLSAASGGLPERFVDPQASVVGAFLLALLAATATVMVACVASAPAGVSGVPAAFGPMASTMVLGGTGVLRILYGADSFGVRGQLDPAHHLSVFGVFLVIAALLIGGTIWLTHLRTQPHHPEKPTPEPTAEPTTVA